MSEQEYLSSNDLQSLCSHLASISASVRKSRWLGIACIEEVENLIADPRALEAFHWLRQNADRKTFRRLRDLDRISMLVGNSIYEASEEFRLSGHENGPPPDVMAMIQMRMYAIQSLEWIASSHFGAFNLWVLAMVCQRAILHESHSYAKHPDWNAAPLRESRQLAYLRDIFGNPFRPVAFDPTWRTADTSGIAGRMYESRDFSAMPILADAFEEAGCTNSDVLLHCREPGVHVRGCWVVDLMLGKS